MTVVGGTFHSQDLHKR